MVSCHSGGAGPVAPDPPFGHSPGPFTHVFIVVEENEGYDDVITSGAMPYLSFLASQFGLATEYYGTSHPSIGNYFMLTVGDTITTDNNYSTVVSTDNIVRRLLQAGLTWKSYAESLPSVGYTGPDTGIYARRHNVLALLSDVVQSPAQTTHLVPFGQFAVDFANNAFPNYSFIVPNLCNDGHDCPLSAADIWLQTNIGPLLASQQFQQDGLLIITFDEARDSDTRNGGGRVPWVAISAKTKRGYQSAAFYQHQSTLRLVCEAFGLPACPNQAAVAPSMREFFTY
jgi:acid phosphatase